MRTSASPLVLAVALAFPAAHAEEPSTLGTVSVTAKGYAADDLETPLSTTSLDRAELLAQGSGRLIRSTADKGVVAVLDPRLATARYGTYSSATSFATTSTGSTSTLPAHNRATPIHSSSPDTRSAS